MWLGSFRLEVVPSPKSQFHACIIAPDVPVKKVVAPTQLGLGVLAMKASGSAFIFNVSEIVSLHVVAPPSFVAVTVKITLTVIPGT